MIIYLIFKIYINTRIIVLQNNSRRLNINKSTLHHISDNELLLEMYRPQKSLNNICIRSNMIFGIHGNIGNENCDK